MTITVAEFRTNFPAFVSSTVYPDVMVQMYLDLGYKLLRERKWQDILDTGVQFFTAHNLTLDAQANKQSAAGGIPTGQVGAVGSKAVAQVSVSYDNSSSMQPDAGHWNLTVWGKRFAWLMRMAGAGGLQV